MGGVYRRRACETLVYSADRRGRFRLVQAPAFPHGMPIAGRRRRRRRGATPTRARAIGRRSRASRRRSGGGSRRGEVEASRRRPSEASGPPWVWTIQVDTSLLHDAFEASDLGCENAASEGTQAVIPPAGIFLFARGREFFDEALFEQAL